jgi:glycosyltransferase involved in cell wall biosynthesis
VNKKLLFLIDKVESGGAENVLIKIMNHFNNKKNKVFLLPNLTIKKKYLNKLESSIIYIDPKIKINGVFTRFYSFFKYFVIVLFFVKKEKPDYLISFLERSNIINILVSKITNTPSIISTRNNLSQQYSGRSKITKSIIRFLIRYFYNKADKIISLSESVKYDLVENFGVNSKLIKTVYNPYDLKRISILSNEVIKDDELYLFNNGYTCITVGRLTEQKGHIYLIRSFLHVVKQIPTAKLIILGEGELKTILRIEIEKLNLSNNVFLLGYRNNPYKYVKNSKLFLFSSLWEGFGNALLEAMACGTAVISTDCDSGPSEILSKKSKYNETNFTLADFGVLTPVMRGSYKSELIYANAIIKLLKEDVLRCHYEDKAIERSKDFSNEKVLNLWDETILND